MNTQIVHVPEKGTRHHVHTRQECPGHGLAFQQSAADSSVLLSSRLLSWEYQPAWFSLYHSRLGKMTTWEGVLQTLAPLMVGTPYPHGVIPPTVWYGY